MLNKKMMTSAVLLGMMSLGFAGQAFADEGETQIIDGMKGQTSADVTTRGNLGKIDPTDPETPLPEGDNRWIKVTLPTAVVFESDSTDAKKITSSVSNYEIKNESGRPVKVDVEKYAIKGGAGAKALSELNIKRGNGYIYDSSAKEISASETSSVKLTKEKGVGNDAINQEFVRLANNKGEIGGITDADTTTKFEFTGTIEVGELEESQNFVESNLTFKFTALRMDGKTVDEAK
ncbi:hypothetical protein V8429_002848 [Listeria monocytogenes]|nr:hypothetical protein [Listeria monocytogenes]EJM7953520.1 hypothetical protein [Listeria monocytogenes]EJN2365993.1 hypothetical protein [Listeria monocytogenes]HBJ8698666.1 hypothetical protein [Listeria monocytogenes]HBJ9902558.1 hypothetical protein [Listeria monocytogenes]